MYSLCLFVFLISYFNGATCGTIHVLALLIGAFMRLSSLKVLLVAGLSDREIVAFHKEVTKKK